MNPWMPFPFMRFVLWLLSGILAGYYFFSDPGIGAILFLAAGACYCLIFFFRSRLPASRSWLGLMACLFLFFLGFGRMQQQKAALQPGFVPADTSYYLLEVQADGTLTSRSIKYRARILAFRQKGEWKGAKGGLILYLERKDLERVAAYGDRFLLRAALQKVPEALNPHVFNYKSFLSKQGVHYQAFVKSSQLALVSHQPKPLLASARRVQAWGSQQLATYLPGSRESSIAAALLLGNRSELEEDTKQAYATAGVMHILAVSGLHVGFIFLLLRWLFRPLRRTSAGKWGGFICTLLLLWAYAFVTGLSPSVLRAVCMFSLLSFALLLKRKSGIYNTLAVVAFCLLLYDPFFIFSVGFQLSFLALLGIVYLQPKLSVLYSRKKKIYRRLFDLLAVSLAAQLATFPLGLFYFGQFPTYFLFANLLVVPAAGFMVVGGLLLLLSSLFSSSLASGIGYLLDGLIRLVNKVIFFTDRLPYSRLNSTLEQTELLLLFAFLFLLMVLISQRRLLWASLTFLVAVGFISNLFYTLFLQRQQQKLIAYHVSGFSAIHLIEGRKEYLLTPEPIPKRQLQYQVQPNRLASGLMEWGNGRKARAFNPPTQQQAFFKLMVWRGKSIVVISEEPEQDCRQQTPLKVDLLVISGNKIKDLEKLNCFFAAEKLIIDGSNYFWLQEQLARQAEELRIPYHLTAESGAYVLNLRE